MSFAPQEFSAQQLKNGEILFKEKTTFVLGVAHLDQLPPDNLPEIAFVGRSNVGKSSLINAITSQKGLAKTSNTPGRTQQLNFFNLEQKLYIVDLPGYGYAQAPESQVKHWQSVIFAYLRGRASLKRVFLLVDSRHGLKQIDKEIMQMLDKAAVTYQLVLTKIDKISKTALDQILAETIAEAANHAAAYTRILATSSEKKSGIEQLRAEIAEIVDNKNTIA